MGPLMAAFLGNAAQTAAGNLLNPKKPQWSPPSLPGGVPAPTFRGRQAPSVAQLSSPLLDAFLKTPRPRPVEEAVMSNAGPSPYRRGARFDMGGWAYGETLIGGQ